MQFLTMILLKNKLIASTGHIVKEQAMLLDRYGNTHVSVNATIETKSKVTNLQYFKPNNLYKLDNKFMR